MITALTLFLISRTRYEKDDLLNSISNLIWGTATVVLAFCQDIKLLLM